MKNILFLHIFAATILIAALTLVPVSAATGTVTISGSPSGPGPYYTGDRITFSGTNTASGTTYLFLTGPGLRPAGSQIQSEKPASHAVVDGDAATFQEAAVGADNRWSWTWDTHATTLDPGTYRVYAAGSPRDAIRKSNTVYDSAAVIIDEPVLTITARPADAITGETVSISGTAKGSPAPGIAIWVFGPQYSERSVVRPDSGGSYSLGIGNATAPLAEGDYHAVVQHPGKDGGFGITLDGDFLTDTTTKENIFRFRGNGSLYGDLVYRGFLGAIDDPSVDDQIKETAFSVHGSRETTSVTVSVSPPDGGTYILGDGITISGTNTDSATTYLFLTGPGLADAGSQIRATNPGAQPIADGKADTFGTVPVSSGDTWQWRWDTRGVGIGPGTYTVYAVSTPHDREHLAGTKNSQALVVLAAPSVSATGSPQVIRPGDLFFVNGTANGHPFPGIAVWIFGNAFSKRYTEKPGPDGNYSFRLDNATTRSLQPGRYYVIVQHPMQDDMFDVDSVGNGVYSRVAGTGLSAAPLFTIAGPGSPNGADAAAALRDALANPAVDDTYGYLEFSVKNSTAALPSVTVMPATVPPENEPANPGDPLSWIFSGGATGPGTLPVELIAAVSGIILIGGISGAVLIRRGRTGSKKKGPAQKPSPPPRPAGTGIRKGRPGIPPGKTLLSGDNTTGSGSSAAMKNSFPEELSMKYTWISTIGSGGFAIVYSAYRTEDNRNVAIKVPIRHDEQTGQSFLKEMTIWKRLHHPNIVEVLAANILPVPYVEMEYVPGSLEAIPKPLPVQTAARIICDIAGAIRFAHEQRVIHRDIKPQNILIADNLVPKITDWGMSKMLEESAKKTTMAGFSLMYAAPEQIEPEKFGSTDERTDIYQIGVVFFELVTGSIPFGGESMMEMVNAILYEEPILPSRYNPDAEGVDAIILKCLAKDPDKRYQSADELVRALREFLENCGEYKS